MSYYFTTKLEMPFHEAIEAAKSALKRGGFGVLTEIDVVETLKKKLDVDFRPYVILGACNPPFAHRALETEDKIGLMLPCNVIVQDAGGGLTEVAAIDPLATMRAVENPSLADIGEAVSEKLARVIEELGSA